MPEYSPKARASPRPVIQKAARSPRRALTGPMEGPNHPKATEGAQSPSEGLSGGFGGVLGGDDGFAADLSIARSRRVEIAW